MGRRQGARRAHPAPFLHWGEKPEQPECKNGAGCNRRATQPPAHFHRNPLGGPFFRVARSSRIDSDTIVATASPARTALKNSQLTCGERHAYFGDRTQVPSMQKSCTKVSIDACRSRDIAFPPQNPGEVAERSKAALC